MHAFRDPFPQVDSEAEEKRKKTTDELKNQQDKIADLIRDLEEKKEKAAAAAQSSSIPTKVGAKLIRQLLILQRKG